MKTLRLFAAAIAVAWMVLPSEASAQCSGTIEIDASLGANQTASASANFAVGAVSVDVDMTWSGSGGSYPADLLVYVTAPDGSCVVFGGYSTGLPTNGCTNLGTGYINDPWPGGWNTTASGNYDATVNVAGGNLSGSGEWVITIMNGWANSSGADYDIVFTINGDCLGECPDPEACNYVPEDEQTNPLLDVCQYPEDLFGPGYNCDGECNNDDDADGICDEVDPCVGQYDVCGVCNGLAMCISVVVTSRCREFAMGAQRMRTVMGFAMSACPPGYWLDIEEVMEHTEGELAGMITYRVSLGCENPTDYLYSYAGGGVANGSMEITSTTGTWFNHPVNPSWNASGLVADSVALYPDLAYDSFMTIGSDDADSAPFPIAYWPIADPRPEFEPGGGNNVLIDEGNGFNYLPFPGIGVADTHPGFAGDDLRVLMLQITTSGEISGQMVVRIYPFGVAANAVTLTLGFDSQEYCFNLDDCIDTDGDAICDDEDDCVDVDEDEICDEDDDCVGEYDVCGVCNGEGDIYDCGCSDIPDGDCDCDGNQLDALGVCGGECATDEDADGICDDVDECIGEIDACGVCNGPGDIYECGCSDIPEGDCDCDGNQLDVIGVCGGECTADEDEDGICDDVDPCVGEYDALGVCNSHVKQTPTTTAHTTPMRAWGALMMQRATSIQQPSKTMERVIPRAVLRLRRVLPERC